MKTITLKNALKLFFFLLILFSVKSFSHVPKISNDKGSDVCETKFGCVKKVTKNTRATSKTYSKVLKSNAKQSKNSLAME